MASLGLDQRIQSVDLLTCLELFLFLREDACHTASHLHQFIARFRNLGTSRETCVTSTNLAKVVEGLIVDGLNLSLKILISV